MTESFEPGTIVWTSYRGLAYQARVVKSDRLMTDVTLVNITGKEVQQWHPTTAFRKVLGKELSA